MVEFAPGRQWRPQCAKVHGWSLHLGLKTPCASKSQPSGVIVRDLWNLLHELKGKGNIGAQQFNVPGSICWPDNCHAISRMQRANSGRLDSRKGRVDMWFIVAQFLVVYAVRCAVISSFISVCSVLKCDDAQHLKFLVSDDHDKRDCAARSYDGNNTHQSRNLCRAGFRFRGWQLCRCGQESHTSTVLRQVMEYVSFGRFVTVIHCRGGQGKSRVQGSL